MFNAPIVWVCEYNKGAAFAPTSFLLAADSMLDYGQPYGMPTFAADGNDIMATLAEVVGDPFPEASTTDSQSFLPVLKGDTRYQVRETLIVNFKAPAFRHNNWKLITQKGPGGFTHWDGNPDEEPDGQLYDLAVDPSEKNNLWDVKPGMVKTLLSMLEVEKANAK